VTGNWIGLAGWTLLVMAPLLYRIHVEENALLAAVGDRYRTYASVRSSELAVLVTGRRA
jgi:protein-S-isoprenylcysteine O-methyltransferase Ste14